VILKLKDANNGFIIEVDPEITMGMSADPFAPSPPLVQGRYITKVEHHVFKDVEEMLTFIREFYAKRPNKNTPPRSDP